MSGLFRPLFNLIHKHKDKDKKASVPSNDRATVQKLLQNSKSLLQSGHLEEAFTASQHAADICRRALVAQVATAKLPACEPTSSMCICAVETGKKQQTSEAEPNVSDQLLTPSPAWEEVVATGCHSRPMVPMVMSFSKYHKQQMQRIEAINSIQAAGRLRTTLIIFGYVPKRLGDLGTVSTIAGGCRDALTNMAYATALHQVAISPPYKGDEIVGQGNLGIIASTKCPEYSTPKAMKELAWFPQQ